MPAKPTSPDSETREKILEVKMYAAAVLIVEGELTLEQISKEVDCPLWALKDLQAGWRSKPEFQTLMEDIGESYRREARNKVRRRANQIVARLVQALEAGPKVQKITVSDKTGTTTETRWDWSAALQAARELREWMKPDPPSELRLRHGGDPGNPIETVARVVIDWDGNGHVEEDRPDTDSPVGHKELEEGEEKSE